MEDSLDPGSGFLHISFSQLPWRHLLEPVNESSVDERARQYAESWEKKTFVQQPNPMSQNTTVPQNNSTKPNPSLGGIKYDAEKPTFDLIPWEALGEIQQILEFGAEKYSPWNWEGGFNWLRLWNALMRHSFAWVGGEDIDPDSGFSHLSHMGCCILFLISHELRGLGVDNRRKRNLGSQ